MGLTGLSGLSGLSAEMGGYPIFNPTTVSGLLFDLNPALGMFSDAGTTPAVNNDPVQQAVEQSAAAIVLTQATLGSRPHLISGWLADKPVLRFDGGDALVQATLPAAFKINAFTFVLVCKASAAEGGRPLDLGADAHDHYIRLRNNGSITQLQINNYTGSGGANSAGGVIALGTTNYHVLTMVVDAPNLNHDGFVDGTIDPDSTVALVTADWSGTTSLNVGQSAVAGSFFNGDLARVLIYDHALTTGERHTVERGIGAMYGLAVA